MMKNIFGRACDISDETAPLPENPVPAMSYVPFQQWESTLFAPEQAFDEGTLFPVLNRPFYGRRGAPK